MPRIVILDKEVIYRSAIYFTPLLSYNEIDYDSILAIVDTEYKTAGIMKRDLSTGAVIITGETSRKDNAEKVLSMLSGYAGEFVVATAGPDLEAVLAAKGAGVQAMSKEMQKSIANFDIGGGTTNVAVFRNGQLMDTTCADIGGRLIRVGNGRITYVAPKAQWLAARRGIQISVGDAASEAVIRRLADAMAEVLFGILRRDRNEETEHMLTVTGLMHEAPVDAVTFSGGVADLIYGKAGGESRGVNKFEYGDAGAILGDAIRESGLFKAYTVLRPLETIRATVIGAGIHSMELSGSTIEYTGKTLPLKNIPIVRLSPDEEAEVNDSFPNIAEAVAKKISWYKEDSGYQTVALSFFGKRNPTYRQIQALCNALCEGLGDYPDSGAPVVVVVEMDMAKALGQALRIKLGNRGRIVCIDTVSAHNGDYIDIGMPLAYGRVVPVIVKTLALNV